MRRSSLVSAVICGFHAHEEQPSSPGLAALSKPLAVGVESRPLGITESFERARSEVDGITLSNTSNAKCSLYGRNAIRESDFQNCSCKFHKKKTETRKKTGSTPTFWNSLHS